VIALDGGRLADVRIVITGAAGRIGRQMILELSDSHEIVALDRRQPRARRWHCVDLTKGGLRRRYAPDSGAFSWERYFEGADAVLHLAGNASPRDSMAEVLQTNVQGTWNVLEAASRQGVPRIVFASTNWVVRRELLDLYVRDELPLRGIERLSPNTPYGLSKAAAELAGRMAVEDGRIACFIGVRIGRVEARPLTKTKGSLGDRLTIGAADLRTLLRLCLERPLKGFHLVYGVSPVPGAAFDLDTTRRLLDWSPVDIPERPAVCGRAEKTA
jgi:uronate dehydrogenase